VQGFGGKVGVYFLIPPATPESRKSGSQASDKTGRFGACPVAPFRNDIRSIFRRPVWGRKLRAPLDLEPGLQFCSILLRLVRSSGKRGEANRGRSEKSLGASVIGVGAAGSRWETASLQYQVPGAVGKGASIGCPQTINNQGPKEAARFAAARV
jgi:hypothetical protein